jgi:2-haloacid dehalogenase
MSRFNGVDRRQALGGIGAATAACIFDPANVWSQTLDVPPEVLVFDVAGTLMDLQSMRQVFERMFGDGAVVSEWFGETILYSEAETLTDTFTPFSQLAAGVLRMLGRIYKVPITEADVAEVAKGLASLPPYADVPEGLRMLKAAGYRLVTLTDSSATPGKGPLQVAGLAALFERQLSAETVRRYKPARETYAMVADATGVKRSDLCVIAAHPWDVIGARLAGCSAALIERDGVAPLFVSGLKQAQISGPTLIDVAAQLVRLKHA